MVVYPKTGGFADNSILVILTDYLADDPDDFSDWENVPELGDYFKKWSAKSATSSRRSRKGGTVISTTCNR